MNKINIKNKRIWFGAAAVILVLISVFGSRYILAQNDPYTPEDTVSTMDNGKSQVFVTGNGYMLDQDMKREHEESERERTRILNEQIASHQQTSAQKRISSTREQQPKQKPDVTPPKKEEKPVVRPPIDPKKSDPDDDDEEEYYKKPDKERDVLPTITTSLRDGQKFKGTTVSFWVTATDYQKQNIPVFSNGDGKFDVLVNGTKISSSGSSGNKTSFRAPVKEGTNTIKITATDKRGKTRTITRRIKCETKQEEKPVGTVYVSISAPSLGLGTISDNIAVKITANEPLHDVLAAAFKAKGFSSSMSSTYLKGISKSGIAKGASISDELRERAEEKRYKVYDEEDWPKGWEDRLYEKDFCSGSGWIYKINGETPGVGINACIPNDGDEIELVFVLFDGE